MKRLLVIGLLVLATRAHAEPEQRAVALLPLDADAKLELYGQPLASEVARALKAGGLQVIVVDPHMAVPSEARLIVDGTIKSKGASVIVTMRIRDANVGTVFDPPITVTAPNQLAMDHATEELAAKMLQPVKTKLDALIEEDKQKQQKPEVKPPVVVKAEIKLAPMLIYVHGKSGEPLVDELKTTVSAWAAHRHHAVRLVDKLAPADVAAQKVELAIDLEVLGLVTDHDEHQIPLTRARVHMKIADPQSVAFDRTIVTDTIVGEKNLEPAKLISRVAREVLSIADPQVKRRIPTWY